MRLTEILAYGGNWRPANNACKFRIKCVDKKRSKSLTVGKTYWVVQLGMNGYFKIRTDTGRWGWYHPSYFNYKQAPDYVVSLIMEDGLFGAGMKRFV